MRENNMREKLAQLVEVGILHKIIHFVTKQNNMFKKQIFLPAKS